MFVMAPRAHAQTSHAAPQSALDAAVQQHVASTDADREAVLRLLDRDDVKKVAKDAGIDVRSASAAVASMDPATLAQVAGQARVVDEALAGGQSSITISTTMIIIGLLVLILIIVAVN
jgi:hypothetical protein